MSSILKKSLRSERRFKLDGLCNVYIPGRRQKVLMYMEDFSTVGLSLTGVLPALTINSEIQLTPTELQFTADGLTLKGRVVQITEYKNQDSENFYRCAVRFDRKLSQQEFSLLLEACSSRSQTGLVSS